jgi:hypothetical protein
MSNKFVKRLSRQSYPLRQVSKPETPGYEAVTLSTPLHLKLHLEMSRNLKYVGNKFRQNTIPVAQMLHETLEV